MPRPSQSPKNVPAAARPFERTPEQMALGAAAIDGLAASLAWDTPAGPSIAVVATLLFALGLAVGAVLRGRVG